MIIFLNVISGFFKPGIKYLASFALRQPVEQLIRQLITQPVDQFHKHAMLSYAGIHLKKVTSNWPLLIIAWFNLCVNPA